MVTPVDLVLWKWLVAFALIVTILVIWVRSKFSHWKKKKVPHLQPKFPWGNLESLFAIRKSIGHVYWDFYKTMKERGAKHAGFYMFTSPVYVPIDPECIKQVLIKEFSSFHDRGFYKNERDQPMSANLFTVDGPKWRTLRYKFSPIFTTGKIKYMYNLVVDCVHPLLETIASSAKNKQPINAKDLISRYTMDTIGMCAFGINCNSFSENYMMHKMITRCVEESSKFVRFAVLNIFPNLCRFLRMGLFVDEPIRYYSDVITDSYELRKKNLVHRTDFLQLMKDVQEKRNGEDFDLTLDEIRAQSFIFFLGGFETSSTAMAYLFLELAEDVKMQERLRREVREVLARHGAITFEALHEMKYLQCIIDVMLYHLLKQTENLEIQEKLKNKGMGCLTFNVMQETLRKYTPVTVLNRICTDDYRLPNGELLEKGTNVIVPVLGIHRDPEFYPNPDRFDPDRFSEENREKLHPYTYLPFGDGPRNCIGSRFGLVQMKVAVSQLVSKFRFTVNKNMDTTRRYTSHFVLTFAEDILLDVEEVI